MKTAIVIDPPGFDEKAAWKECRDWQDSHGSNTMAAAFGADPGICSCPSCHEMYWAWGRRQRCVVCNFEYETDAWAMYSWGVQAKWRGKLYDHDKKRLKHPYFCYGFHNPPDRGTDLRSHYESMDWRTIMATFSKHMEYRAIPDPPIENAIIQAMRDVDVARAAIVQHIGPWKQGAPAGGVIDCPVCKAKGSLGFVRAGINGHIHAKCRTENCVSWME